MIYLVFLQIMKFLIIDDYISSCLKNKPYINQKYLEYFSPEFDPKSTETDLFFSKKNEW